MRMTSKAKFLRTYSNDVTLLSLDDKNEETAKSLREAGVKVAGPVSHIEHGGDDIRAVLQGGQTLSFDVVYPALGCGVRSELAVALGASPTCAVGGGIRLFFEIVREVT
jgi:thioredoxin reductase (NADPH)